jgi:hypothetical protein
LPPNPHAPSSAAPPASASARAATRMPPTMRTTRFIELGIPLPPSCWSATSALDENRRGALSVVVKSALHDEKHENDEDEDRDQRVEGDRGSSQPPASGQDVRARETEPAQEELPGDETQPSFAWSMRFGGHETGLPVAIALDEEEHPPTRRSHRSASVGAAAPRLGYAKRNACRRAARTAAQRTRRTGPGVSARSSRRPQDGPRAERRSCTSSPTRAANSPTTTARTPHARTPTIRTINPINATHHTTARITREVRRTVSTMCPPQANATRRGEGTPTVTCAIALDEQR